MSKPQTRSRAYVAWLWRATRLRALCSVAGQGWVLLGGVALFNFLLLVVVGLTIRQLGQLSIGTAIRFWFLCLSTLIAPTTLFSAWKALGDGVLLGRVICVM